MTATAVRTAQLDRQTRRRRKQGRPPWLAAAPPWVRALKALSLVLIVITMLYPLVYVIAMSFAVPSQARAGVIFPTAFSADAYRAIFNGGTVTTGLLNSVWLTGVGTSLSLAATAMLAWGLSRTRQVPGARAVLLMVLATMFFGAGIIPNFLLVKALGLLDSLWALILPGLISAFNMIVMRNFFMNLPGELMDAAKIDGAGEWRIFLRIVLPLSKPVLAVIGLFYGVGYWNAFFHALLYISDASKWPLQLVLRTYVVNDVQMGAQDLGQAVEAAPPQTSIQMAILVISIIPIIIVYPFLQKHFAKG
ncbi:MAG TPA: carbohydrate ABC transporter permease, partial [Jiangellaceae bacterium]|nr:carbohydrate ABC transporter permease [Jiangellaceae bacterium]